MLQAAAPDLAVSGEPERKLHYDEWIVYAVAPDDRSPDSVVMAIEHDSQEALSECTRRARPVLGALSDSKTPHPCYKTLRHLLNLKRCS